ncbi:hypothetical protein EDD29_8948 [Actinocorallia herbida]|uniref:Uncharacterized protein n=1 Tax=Actinocorallia herbida TaxID=58109 RepID=A0A3N1DDF4_9ACTN|nr:hypothetical protein EDD29_8948 [Actinocorallia herbida]
MGLANVVVVAGVCALVALGCLGLIRVLGRLG